jgi:hypothetical protein
MLGLRDSRLSRWSVLANVEPIARVNVAKSRNERLAHENPQKLYLGQRRVFADFVNTELGVTLLPPIHEVADVLARKLSRNRNFAITQKGREILP